MAVAERRGLFTTKPAQVLVSEADEQGHQLRRVVGLLDLSALGLGAIIGTLFAFVLVNIGVIILRRTRPDLERGFRVPFVPVVPIIGCLLCGYLMITLPLVTWVRFAMWMALGLAIYFLYGRSHSRLRTAALAQPPEPSRFDRRS